jgi:4-diphosphocytidyl-2-C-methyl-D-erythritol kinase
MSMQELAPLKLNLFLHIVGRRPDGYHLLQSLFIFADAGDRIIYEASEEPLRLEIEGPFAASLGIEPDNLVLRAAHLLSTSPRGILILDKQVPVAAGLGGGSADAAATLRLLNRAWRCGYDVAALRQMGAQLGADVPACIESRPVYVGGIGEDLTPASIRQPLPLLVVNPGIATATPAVFAKYREAKTVFSPLLTDWPRPTMNWQSCKNALEQPAIKIVPEIQTVLERLKAQPGSDAVRMSGSGASCFATFDSIEHLKNAQKQLKTDKPAWWVCATQMKTFDNLNFA